MITQGTDMLVLKRREGEEIVVNENLRIRVLKTTNGGCSLAFDAPRLEVIRRAEIAPFAENVLQSTASSMAIPQ